MNSMHLGSSAASYIYSVLKLQHMSQCWHCFPISVGVVSCKAYISTSLPAQDVAARCGTVVCSQTARSSIFYKSPYAPNELTNVWRHIQTNGGHRATSHSCKMCYCRLSLCVLTGTSYNIMQCSIFEFMMLCPFTDFHHCLKMSSEEHSVKLCPSAAKSNADIYRQQCSCSSTSLLLSTRKLADTN